MKIKGHEVTATQADVYDVLKKFGPLPDQQLVPLVQVRGTKHRSASSIRSRRAEITGVLVQPVGTITTSSGRKARTFKVV